MGAVTLDDPFFAAIPTFARFEGVVDPANYRPLPDHWVLATTDIVGSTRAIAGGRYKAVNMAGASMISALLNALGRRDLPFVFGGDGALVAFPEQGAAIAEATLAATQAWAADELELTLRAALVPMREVRARGLDVRVALFRASPDVSYAMFIGGGASWAEAEMKAGRYAVAAAPSGTRPDLSGLSCRWNPIHARHGEIVSIIAVPASGADMQAFQKLVADVLAIAAEQDRGGHPVPSEGPEFGISPAGLEAEARAATPKGRRFLTKLSVLAQMLLVMALHKANLSIGRFDARRYTREVADNSDFRKFDDGLKMTLDLDQAGLARIEARLRQAEAEGVCRFGLHRQDSALMTCIVATPLQSDHIHFIDGAAGGYALAAANLKSKQMAAAA
ncbi:DUF3095 domain-containing protein [Kumtagia ephedrae]|uniref:Adenylate cyclase n=1 Tax=Kumtagia ephedrae TaxID=2116701 RepID=A0A2P7S3F6_9HYPH|nr:DUF3095 domain-containing protein [Mesorhizobium ephedrae]PSJ56971.1 adenylate cyclase [Mesorhizobium ephedrae]